MTTGKSIEADVGSIEKIVFPQDLTGFPSQDFRQYRASPRRLCCRLTDLPFPAEYFLPMHRGLPQPDQGELHTPLRSLLGKEETSLSVGNCERSEPIAKRSGRTT